MQTDWLAIAQLLWKKYHDEKLSREEILLKHCAELNFPQDDMRLRQVLKLKNLLPEFQLLINKGLHSLDYLSLLATCSPDVQKYYLQQIVNRFLHYYHTKRPHLSLNMLTPSEFVAAHAATPTMSHLT